MFVFQNIFSISDFHSFIDEKIEDQYPSLVEDESKKDLLIKSLYKEFQDAKSNFAEDPHEGLSSGRSLRQISRATSSSMDLVANEKKSG